MTATETVTLTLKGHVPSKKNRYRKAKRHIYIDTEVAAQIDWLTLQAAEQWRQRAPLVHPEVTARFYVRDRRSDQDNKWQTVQDCLRHAGVIRNDSVRWFNGTLTILPAIVDPEERVVIEISGGENGEKPKGAGRAKK